MVKVDLNRITRKEFSEIVEKYQVGEMKDEDTARLVEKVVIEWDYDQPITADGFGELGLLDSREVEQAVIDALDELSKKN